MYKLEVLPVAKEDMVEIVRYISRDLKDPAAAHTLSDALFAAMESVTEFPYANPAYVPIRPLRFEYRKLMVKNYLMLYRVDEQKKTVTVSRVIYAKRDYDRFLG